MLGVGLGSATNRRTLPWAAFLVYVGAMLRNRLVTVSATKGTFGAGSVVRDRLI
jgi:hypothetical protein